MKKVIFILAIFSFIVSLSSFAKKHDAKSPDYTPQEKVESLDSGDNRSDSADNQTAQQAPKAPSLASKYVKENTFIDIDIIGLNKSISFPETRSASYEEDFAKSKAASYRFYSKVYMDKDSMYVTDLKNGAEINVSERVFQAFKKNLDDINNAIKEAQKKGEHFEKPDPASIDFSYLLE